MQYHRLCRNDRQLIRGFSLVELAITIVVIGILAAIGIVVYNGIQGRAHTAATAANVRQYVSALARMDGREETFPAGSGCIGKITTTDDDCFALRFDGTQRYTGEGCSAYFAANGINPQEPTVPARNTALDAAMERYLGTLPDRVQTAPRPGLITVAENCALNVSVSAASYQSFHKITFNKDEANDGFVTVSATMVGGGTYGPTANQQAWMIQYTVPGIDSECLLDGAHKGKSILDIIPDANLDFTTCVVAGGNVIYNL